MVHATVSRHPAAACTGHTVVCARPVALFMPLAAIVFSLKNCEGYIRAILIKQLERRSLNKGAGAHPAASLLPPLLFSCRPNTELNACANAHCAFSPSWTARPLHTTARRRHLNLSR